MYVNPFWCGVLFAHAFWILFALLIAIFTPRKK